MKGDLSRETFDSAAHYRAVRMQQGRVITDADFNEQGDITRYRLERLAEDTIGPDGAPADDPGYGLAAATHALAVQAFDANNTWIAGEDGALLRTANNGVAWTLAPSGSTRHLRALGRVGNVGWAVGDGGTVLRTNNGGAGWTARRRAGWRCRAPAGQSSTRPTSPPASGAARHAAAPAIRAAHTV